MIINFKLFKGLSASGETAVTVSRQKLTITLVEPTNHYYKPGIPMTVKVN